MKIDEEGDDLRYRAYARAKQDKQFDRINVPTGTHSEGHYSEQQQKGYQKRAKHIKRQKPEVVCIRAEGIGKKIAEYSEYQSRDYRQYCGEFFAFEDRIEQKAQACLPH